MKGKILTNIVELKRQIGKRTGRSWHELPLFSHEIKFNLHQGRGKVFYMIRQGMKEGLLIAEADKEQLQASMSSATT